MDATQYRVTKDGIVTTVFYDADRDTYCDPITRKEIPDDDIGLGIKVYNQIASHGAAAPLVFHVADENLSKDEFRVQKLESCGHDCNPNSFSWLVTTHSRCGNDAFYNWFILNSMLPFVDDCKKASGMKDPTVFYSMDGEEIQMRAYMRDIWQPYFEAMKIVLGKHSASCSAIANSLDAGYIHMGTKKRSKFLDEYNIKIGKEAIENRLDSILVALFISDTEKERGMRFTGIKVIDCDTLERTNTILKQSKKLTIIPTWEKKRREMLTDKLMRVLTAYRDVLRPYLIVDSFKKVGQLPDDDEDFFESKLSLCKINIPLPVYYHLKKKFPECVQEFRDHGKLRESFMDEIGVPKDDESSDRRTVPKDQRVLYQQRACILNHVVVKAFYDAYEQKKRDAPLLRKEKQNQKKAEIDEKKRIVAVKKAARDEEKRIAAEKKAENDEKKRIAADEKAKLKQIAAEKKAKSDELKRIAAEEKEPAKSTTLSKKFTTKRKHSAKGEDYLDQTEGELNRKKRHVQSSSCSPNDTVFDNTHTF